MSRLITGTERAGFEPAMECQPHTRLAGECLQPLGHLSRAPAVYCPGCHRQAPAAERDPAAPGGTVGAGQLMTAGARWRADRRKRAHNGLNAPTLPPATCRGGVAERSNAAVLKTVGGGNVARGFESLPLRLVMSRDIGDRCLGRC